MYFNILKRDLKRKKTMNTILLLFTILASMFVASGLNNVITVMNGTDYYFDKAGVGDYVIITQNGDGGVTEILENSENVDSYRTEQVYFVDQDNITVDSGKAKTKNNLVILQSVENEGIDYFLSDNTKLTQVNKGEIYLTVGFLEDNQLEIGDELQIDIGNTAMKFKIAGEIKDAFFGSEMMGNVRLIINEEDYQIFAQDETLTLYSGTIFYIESDNVKSLASELTEASHIMFDGDRATLKITYVMDMIVAVIVLVLSVCLIIVSFVILKFVITFTINEEFREIGVMKAIGIRNRKIRSLYMTKYLAVAVAGGIIGMFFSFPFGNMLIQSVSRKMVLGNDNGYLMNVIGTLLVILMMMGFAYLCTGKVNKSTPVDAIRSGQTGERYKQKSVYRLGKARTGSSLYMAVNDVVSSPRRFITIILSFFLCSLFVLGVVLCVDTMKSKNLIKTFGKEADVYITDSKLVRIGYMSEEGNETLRKKYSEIENDLKAAGMPCKVSMEVWYKYICEFGGESYHITFQQNTEVKASEYEYTKGTAPQNANEIAITPSVAKMLGVKIGDKITVDFGGEKRACQVVAYFQSMNQLGKIIRLHEDAPTDMKYCSALMAFLIDFDDHPSDKVIRERIDQIKELYNIEGVHDAAGYCVDCIGVVDTLDAVSKFLMLITVVVVMLVTILMERSFISDEKGQIALLKAIGFKDVTIIKWHVYRFMIVAFLSEILAVILTMPVTRLWCDQIWKMMGAFNVKYYFNPLTLILIYPGIILLITLMTAFVTALYTKKISSRDIVNIE